MTTTAFSIDRSQTLFSTEAGPASAGIYGWVVALTTVVISVALPAQSPTQVDSSGFVTRLGKDTIAVERVVTSPDSVVGDILARAIGPRRFSYGARVGASGQVESFRVVFPAPPGPDTRPMVRSFELRDDSLRVALKRADSVDRAYSVAAPPGVTPIVEPAFGLFQIPVSRALAAHGARVPFAWWVGGRNFEAGAAYALTNGDTVVLTTRVDHFLVTVDRAGRMTAVSDPGGTIQVMVTRIPWPDLDRWARVFAADDAQHGGLGQLSPRDTVRATVGGAALLVDYGRPSVRGRRVYGGIIPWNTVWRTGANQATTLVADKDVLIGQTRVPAGTYTLFSLIRPKQWTLIISRKTGEWGTDYDSTADLARIPMKVSRETSPAERFTITFGPESRSGGKASVAMLTLQWDNTVARIPVRSAHSSGG